MTKRIKIQHIIAIALVAVSLTATFLIYPHTLRRIIEALRDFVTAFGYYFANLFDREESFKFPLHFLELPNSYYNDFLPFDVEELQRKLKEFIPAMFKKNSFLLYLAFISGDKSE